MEGVIYGGGFLLFIILVLFFPIVAVVAESVFLIFAVIASEERVRKMKELFLAVDLVIIMAAVGLECLYLSISDVEFTADWQTQLYNGQRHAPICPYSLPTVISIVVLAFIGFTILGSVNVNKIPPLIPVLSMSAVYAGLIFSCVFTYQIIDTSNLLDYYFLLPPLVFLLMSVRVIYCVIREYKIPEEIPEGKKSHITGFSRSLLSDAWKWPLFAVIFMLPMLGLLFCILMLFGQAPDEAVRAFTETADFRLSKMTPPQNLYYDEHYLCTVAAGGDPCIVKPLRMGIRHGHKVIVNRQLCIANAFEQVLEERAPSFHRAVRGFYDTYGFPIAKHIRRKSTADLVYILMKPLEWIFLTVLYLTDVHPENRIAMQYTGADIKETGTDHGC